MDIIGKYKLIIFDYDDTLVKTIEAKWSQHKETAKRFYDINITDGDLRECWGMPFEQMLNKLYRGADTPDNMAKNYLSLRDNYPKRLHNGSLELVNKVLRNNRKVAVLTAMESKSVKEELKNMGFPLDKFEFIQGAEHTIFHKPDPRVFDPVKGMIRDNGIIKDEIVYVGDAIRDYKAANGFGIDFIGVANGLTSAVEFESEGIKYVSNLDELL